MPLRLLSISFSYVNAARVRRCYIILHTLKRSVLGLVRLKPVCAASFAASIATISVCVILGSEYFSVLPMLCLTLFPECLQLSLVLYLRKECNVASLEFPSTSESEADVIGFLTGRSCFLSGACKGKKRCYLRVAVERETPRRYPSPQTSRPRRFLRAKAGSMHQEVLDP